MLRCRDIVDQSSEFLDREMSLSRRMQYRIHLFMCHHCRRFTRQFRASVAMTKRLPKAPVSQAQVDAVRQQVDSL
ncbi:MAG: zf-HC2 domain-containing protein [Halopseudomonas sp.]